MKKIVLFLLAVLLTPTLAEAAPFKWSGEIKLWSRPLVATQDPGNMLPKPIGVAWPLEITLQEPAAEGRTLVFRNKFIQDDWTVLAMVLWVKNRGEEPYLISQYRLEKAGEFIAECSRYDAIGAFEILPPGSCSGRGPKDLMYGMSFVPRM